MGNGVISVRHYLEQKITNPPRSGVGEEGIISAWGIQESSSEEKAFTPSLNCFINTHTF